MKQAEHSPRSIPRTGAPDSTLALLREGYEFIGNRCQKLNTDIFQTRILLQPTICMSGRPLAELFYQEKFFQREDAAPQRLKKTLLGQQGVQGLDDDTHKQRKALFMSVMNRESVQRLETVARTQWLDAIETWTRSSQPVVLKHAAARILCQSICEWADIPVPEGKMSRLVELLLQLVEGAGKVGPRHWRARHARDLLERRASRLILHVRTGDIKPAAGSALAVIAAHRQPGGTLLPAGVAAVELLNLVRPTVAVTYYVVFVAMALHEHPQYADRVATDKEFRHSFVQEVRRFYPFFPAAIARVRKTFDWCGYTFGQGTRVLLDLYGTNHDKRSWDQPDRFWPERFAAADAPDEFTFIPQGGGDPWQHHRCAGEAITISMMMLAVEMLTTQVTYQYAGASLRLPLNRMPTQPDDGFPITQLRSLAVAGQRSTSAPNGGKSSSSD